mgnify:CR=1 FL=1
MRQTIKKSFTLNNSAFTHLFSQQENGNETSYEKKIL